MSKPAKTRRVTSGDVRAKPAVQLAVPVREVDTLESISLGFRSALVTSEDADGNPVAGVYTGGGMGSPWIELEWKGRRLAIHSLELLAAWVKTFDPEGAAAIEGAQVSGSIGVSVATTIVHVAKGKP